MAALRPTSRVVEALIRQCFGIPASQQTVSPWLGLEGTRLIIQLPHRADYSSSEWRGLIGGVCTHFCYLNKGSAKHGLRPAGKAADGADVRAQEIDAG